MRVNPYLTPDLLAALAQTQQQESTATLELASGSKINTPADDPAGAALVAQLNDSSSRTDSFQRSISSIRGQLSTADYTLSSVVEVLQRAISLGVQGANGTLSDTDRADVAAELNGIQQQLLSLANTSFQGRFVFSGTANTQPFVADGTQPSGVSYQGNTAVNSVEIGNGFQVQVNQPGLQVFAAPGSDMFLTVNNLITSLQANSGITDAVSAVRKAYDNITAQRVFYGNALNQLDSQQNYLNNEKLQLSQQQNAVAGADVPAVASELVNAQNARSATLAAIAKTSQLSLFDYLK